MRYGPTLRTIVLAAVVTTSIVAVRARAASDAPNADAGRALFADKQCARCHALAGEPSAGPAIDKLRRPQGQMELAGRLWNHVPAMFTTLTRDGVQWPAITAKEMADLMAFLQAEPMRDPAPDIVKGQFALMKKGCLKCHSLKREGGPVEPDLAGRRPDYESPAAWAATMWTHTPRMAAMARERHVPYPRFSGDEMGNLVAFLRSAAAMPGAPTVVAPPAAGQR